MTPSETPPEGQPSVRTLKPDRGGAVLALGIVGLATMGCYGVPGIVLGIIAWVMGNNDLRAMNQGLMDPSGRSNTNAGRICGIIATCVGGAFLLAVIAAIIVAIVMGELPHP